jgi:hypothetical protein
MLLLQPTKTVFRNATAQLQGNSYEGWFGRAELFGAVSYSVLTGQAMLGTDIVTFADDRMNAITTFAKVIEDTPDYIPFWNGHTYYPLLSKLVPRLFYRDKPPDDASQAFPHRYKMLADNDLTTSFKLTQLIEAYVNFGTVGVMVVLLVIGSVYRVVQGMFVHPTMGFGAVVGMTYVFTQWFDIEANASLIFGGLVYELLYIGVLSTLIRLVESVQQPTRVLQRAS